MANEHKPAGTGSRPNPGQGQQRTWAITHPTTGEVRENVTTESWRIDKLGQQGFEKPPDMPEGDEGAAADEDR